MSIETERNSSIQLRADTPEFVPENLCFDGSSISAVMSNPLDETHRDIADISAEDAQDCFSDSSESDYCAPTGNKHCKACTKFVYPQIGHPHCIFHYRHKYKDINIGLPMYCPKCDGDLCRNCIDAGGHKCHVNFLEYN